ncbi:MAG: electron transfer flavoprotein subunit beta/FixA family protein [Candidatus Gastranaerophilales bacterium]|nr:electron transfer flavoprotein subunit beta/FixA family protein [Candidatus Gastranaerophilales bacterium]
MKTVVCIKQVPDTADIKWTENNTLIREGVASIVNPCDLYAVDAALQLKYGDNSSEISAVSMGPLQAVSALKYVLAMGADNAFLLSDKGFAGSDTAATARVLSAAIKTKVSDFDLIVCGQYASDGDTAQTGPSLAENLDIPVITNVLSVQKIDDKKIIAKRITDYGIETVEAVCPVLLCVQKNDKKPALPKISGRIKAQKYSVPVYNAADIDIDVETTGFKGSPTTVKKAFNPKSEIECNMMTGKTSDELADIVIAEIDGVKYDG